MKKFFITIFVILFLVSLGIGGFFGYNYYFLGNTKIIKNELSKLPVQNKDNNSQNNQDIQENENIDTDQKISTLRKRFSLRSTIIRGDLYFEQNQPLFALGEYLKALRQNPDDQQIIKKTALAYFELKKYDKSREYFAKVNSSMQDSETDKFILSYIYNTDFTSKESLLQTNEAIKNLSISQEKKFFYINSLNCVLNFHECKKKYEDYILKNNVSYSGLLDVKNSFESFKNFQVKDIYYKDALLIGAIYKNKIYNISNILGINLLKEKKNYKPILLLVGKGYYELGDIKTSKLFLEKYYSLDPKDVNITYLLGNINFKLKDYVSSNLYYNAAFKNGFEPKIDIERKLIYNYYLVGDTRSMMNIFSYLIEEKDATIDDYSLAIYHSILEGRTSNAIKRSEKGLQKFVSKPGYEVFYGYLGWVSREDRDISQAEKYLSQGLKINPKNPLLTLNMGYLEEYKENYNMALIYLKRTYNINGDGEFGELAKKEILEIQKYLEIVKNSQK